MGSDLDANDGRLGDENALFNYKRPIHQAVFAVSEDGMVILDAAGAPRSALPRVGARASGGPRGQPPDRQSKDRLEPGQAPQMEASITAFSTDQLAWASRSYRANSACCALPLATNGRSSANAKAGPCLKMPISLRAGSPTTVEPFRPVSF